MEGTLGPGCDHLAGDTTAGAWQKHPMKSWRKWVRWIAGAAGVLMALIAVGGFFLPTSMEVTKERRMPLPAPDLYERVASLRRWPEWATWWQREPFLEVEHAGPTAGAGATMAWRSKGEGEGRARIMSVSPNREVALAFDFGERGEARSVIQFFESADRKATLVKWTFRTDFGANTGRRYFGLLFRPWVEQDLTEGLARLEAATAAKSVMLPPAEPKLPEKSVTP